MSAAVLAAIMAAALSGTPRTEPVQGHCLITLIMRWDGPVLRYDYGYKTCRLRDPVLRRGLVRSAAGGVEQSGRSLA